MVDGEAVTREPAVDVIKSTARRALGRRRGGRRAEIARNRRGRSGGSSRRGRSGGSSRRGWCVVDAAAVTREPAVDVIKSTARRALGRRRGGSGPRSPGIVVVGMVVVVVVGGLVVDVVVGMVAGMVV